MVNAARTDVAWINVAENDVTWTNVAWLSATGALVNSQGWFQMGYI